MDTAIKPYEEVKTILGSASTAWEKLVGYVRYHYIMDEKWVEGKPTHKNYNKWWALNTPGTKIPSYGTDMLGQRYAYDFVMVDWENRDRK